MIVQHRRSLLKNVDCLFDGMSSVRVGEQKAAVALPLIMITLSRDGTFAPEWA